MLPRQLIRRFRTRDPYELADLLGVTVMPRNNFLRQKGAFSIVAGRSFIFINANLSAELQRLVCAHELGHALLHREIALSGGAMLEFDLLDAAGRCEVEANTFAAALLLDDEELRERLHDGEDIQSIARAMGVQGVDAMSQEEYHKAAVEAVKQLSIDVKIPQTLAEIGVKEEDLEALTDAAMADVCTGGNPRPCTWEEVLGVYKTAFGK